MSQQIKASDCLVGTRMENLPWPWRKPKENKSKGKGEANELS